MYLFFLINGCVDDFVDILVVDFIFAETNFCPLFKFAGVDFLGFGFVRIKPDDEIIGRGARILNVVEEFIVVVALLDFLDIGVPFV